jgi:hypothetical protein
MSWVRRLRIICLPVTQLKPGKMSTSQIGEHLFWKGIAYLLPSRCKHLFWKGTLECLWLDSVGILCLLPNRWAFILERYTYSLPFAI